MIHIDLEHSSNQSVDFFFSISPISTFLEGVSFVAESALRGVELEGPEEVVGLLKVRAAGDEFLDKVLNRSNTESAQTSFNDFVGSEGDSLLVDFSVTSLVDQIVDDLFGGITESNIRLNFLKHIQSGSVYSDQSGVVDLSESEQL